MKHVICPERKETFKANYEHVNRKFKHENHIIEFQPKNFYFRSLAAFTTLPSFKVKFITLGYLSKTVIPENFPRNINIFKTKLN